MTNQHSSFWIGQAETERHKKIIREQREERERKEREEVG